MTPRFIMIGGFLGAGKTTTVGRLARHYTAQGLKVGIVTNDQTTDLVDTHSLRSQGFDVGEVAGACFCCNFNELTATVEQLSESLLPDVILAEPVGSCTDLVATVIRPLVQVYRRPIDVAPYGVILKPSHGARILRNQESPSLALRASDDARPSLALRVSDDARPSLALRASEARGGFSPKAEYIFRKQIEEADFVLINRIDEISTAEIQELAELLDAQYPGRPILRMSARTGTGFDSLVEFLDQRGEFGRRVMDLDYDVYADGEAELGWLNSQALVESATPFDLDALLLDLIGRLQSRFAETDAETAHLKTIGLCDGTYAVANLVSSFTSPELSLPSRAQVRSAHVVVNARVATDPDQLAELVRTELAAACDAIRATHVIQTLQSFRPGRPVPTHRIMEPV